MVIIIIQKHDIEDMSKRPKRPEAIMSVTKESNT